MHVNRYFVFHSLTVCSFENDLPMGNLTSIIFNPFCSQTLHFQAAEHRSCKTLSTSKKHPVIFTLVKAIVSVKS